MWRLFNYLFNWHYALMEFGGDMKVYRTYFALDGGIRMTGWCEGYYTFDEYGKHTSGHHRQIIPLTFSFKTKEK